MSSVHRALWILACLFVTTVWSSAQGADPFAGTWKVNVAKSKYSPGPPPGSATHTFAVMNDGSVKHTIDNVSTQGEKTHSEVTARIDGKDYPVQGGAPKATRAFTRVDNWTIDVTNKADGKVTNTVREVVARDGKTKTATQTGTDAQGQRVSNTILFERQ